MYSECFLCILSWSAWRNPVRPISPNTSLVIHVWNKSFHTAQLLKSICFLDETGEMLRVEATIFLIFEAIYIYRSIICREILLAIKIVRLLCFFWVLVLICPTRGGGNVLANHNQSQQPSSMCQPIKFHTVHPSASHVHTTRFGASGSPCRPHWRLVLFRFPILQPMLQVRGGIKATKFDSLLSLALNFPHQRHRH